MFCQTTLFHNTLNICTRTIYKQYHNALKHNNLKLKLLFMNKTCKDEFQHHTHLFIWNTYANTLQTASNIPILYLRQRQTHKLWQPPTFYRFVLSNHTCLVALTITMLVLSISSTNSSTMSFAWWSCLCCL